jgi:hypothetical protein
MLRKPSGDPWGTVSLSEGEVMNGDCAVQRQASRFYKEDDKVGECQKG